MGQNRQYAGPHVAADLQIDDGAYVSVLRSDITDDQLESLGFTLDVDESVRTGRTLVVRTISVSDELAAKLDRALLDVLDDDGKATGETVPGWPKSGGAAGEPVDSPHTNPSTVPVELEDGSVLTAAELDERAYTAADALEAEERVAVSDDTAAKAAAREREQRDRLAAVEARITEVDEALNAAVEAEDDDAHDKLDAELTNLKAEKADIEKALAAGEGH